MLLKFKGFMNDDKTICEPLNDNNYSIQIPSCMVESQVRKLQDIITMDSNFDLNFKDQVDKMHFETPSDKQMAL